MIVSIDSSSPVPAYEQLRAQISALATAGHVLPGSRLPTVRQLAADLALAPGTVTRAYHELEATGIIVTRGRHGTFVADLVREPLARREQLQMAARSLVGLSLEIGATADEILSVVRVALDEAVMAGQRRPSRRQD
jgi:DNA-binding transcriptional regulator YhcF (GntR family)